MYMNSGAGVINVASQQGGFGFDSNLAILCGVYTFSPSARVPKTCTLG